MTSTDTQSLLKACYGDDYDQRLTELLSLLELGKPLYEKSPIKGQVTAWGDPWEDVMRVVGDAVARAKEEESA